MMQTWDFEKPIIELKNKIEELRRFSKDKSVDLTSEISDLEEKLQALRKEIYSGLSAWQKVQIARHPDRPTTTDYINLIFKDFVSLCGDRLYGDDQALISGFAKLDDKKIAVIGH